MGRFGHGEGMRLGAKIMAVAGKGGVGKTAISAAAREGAYSTCRTIPR